MLKLADKIHSPLSTVITKRTSLFKLEDVGYMSAFLTCLRQKLLPMHSKSLKNYPDKSELDNMYKEAEVFPQAHGSSNNPPPNPASLQCFSSWSTLIFPHNAWESEDNELILEIIS